jgi:hypothetical protein
MSSCVHVPTKPVAHNPLQAQPYASQEGMLILIRTMMKETVSISEVMHVSRTTGCQPRNIQDLSNKNPSQP